MTDKELFAAVRAIPHMTITKRDGEYRVTLRIASIAEAKPSWSGSRCVKHAEAASVYTNDREDALGTARHLSAFMDGLMARKASASA